MRASWVFSKAYPPPTKPMMTDEAKNDGNADVPSGLCGCRHDRGAVYLVTVIGPASQSKLQPGQEQDDTENKPREQLQKGRHRSREEQANRIAISQGALRQGQRDQAGPKVLQAQGVERERGESKLGLNRRNVLRKRWLGDPGNADSHRDITTPSRTDRGTHLARRCARPVAPRKIQSTPVASVAPRTTPAPMPAARLA